MKRKYRNIEKKTSQSRRSFLTRSVQFSAVLPLAHLIGCNTSSGNKSTSRNENDIKPLKILLLGGTSFLGPHQIAYALSRGHSVTTFTRGKTKPTIYKSLFEKVVNLVGNRANDLSALEKGEWDVVIDNSGQKEEWTIATANLLKDRVSTYMYTSSTGVFYPYTKPHYREEAPLATVVPEGISEYEKLEYEYGVMKTLSERAAIKEFGKNNVIVVRPTYMIGPADRSNRFIHWPLRMSKDGEMLVPGKAEDPVQYIDVRDVAEWMIRLAEMRNVGTFNATGPLNAQNMDEFIAEAQKVFDNDQTMVRIDDNVFLKSHNINYIVPWIMPEGNDIGSALISNKKAIQNGLTFRPLKKTILDMYEWWNSDAIGEEKRNEYLNNEKTVLYREKDILASWRKRMG